MSLDYSKWDKLIEYDDLSEDGDYRRGAGDGLPIPRVTRTEQPCSITRTATGEILIHDATVISDENGLHGTRNGGMLSEDLARRTSSSSSRRYPVSEHETSCREDNQRTGEVDSLRSSWTYKGGSFEYKGSKIYWCQDPTTVTLRIRLPSRQDDDSAVDDTTLSPHRVSHQDAPHRSGSKFSFTVSNVLPYHRRFSAVDVEQNCRVVEHRGDDRVCLVEGDLPHPVHADEEEGECITESFDGLDWTIERVTENDQNPTETLYMVVTLNKATPIHGMTLWWKKPFLDAPEISLERFSSGSHAFAKAWKEAHHQFRERVQHRQADSDSHNVS